MTDSFSRMVLREGGGGGGGRKRRRWRASPSRPAYTAHPCADWDEAHQQKHLRACQTARDPLTGEWTPDPENPDEMWCWLWETMGKPRPDGTLDFGPWPVIEVEVP
jgi:hypothetical protein